MITGPQAAQRRSAAVQAAKAKRRDEHVLILQAMGLGIDEIAKRVGCSKRSVYYGMRHHAEAREIMEAELRRTEVTAEHLHDRLSQMFWADIGDIIHLDVDEYGEPNVRAGEFLPVHEWPSIWRRMLSQRDIEDATKRSDDGVQVGQSKAWDIIGKKLKLKFPDPLKLIELLGRHRKVAAFADHTDVNITVHTEVESRLQRARLVAAGIETEAIEVSADDLAKRQGA